jgi:glycosyltransferase involved in cell wall biosynthesis/putative flippase GtrA
MPGVQPTTAPTAGATATAASGRTPPPHEPRHEPPTFDVVLPVHDEVRTLGPSVRRLHAYLSERSPWTWRITIADNASSDGSLDEAIRLTSVLDRVEVVHLDAKGRGLALRQAWSASDAPVVAYMDVDLSTDLDAVVPLVAPLVSGHSDVAIGSRLVAGARVQRGPRRELISRVYNRLLHVVFRNRFRDAQCGFKALRSDVAHHLLPNVVSDGWFFDTELLLLAERNGLRITEIPVDWVDDLDSRVAVVRTAAEDLRGMSRMAVRFWTGRGRLDLGDANRPLVPPGTGGELVSFAAIGLASTVAYIALFVWLRGAAGALGANALALFATMVANTAAHRRWTFARSGRVGRAREWMRATLVFVAGLALTSGAVVAAGAIDRGSAATQVVMVGLASALATGLRFLLLPAWVFRRSRT